MNFTHPDRHGVGTEAERGTFYFFSRLLEVGRSVGLEYEFEGAEF